jgi:hypothetical protein
MGLVKYDSAAAAILDAQIVRESSFENDIFWKGVAVSNGILLISDLLPIPAIIPPEFAAGAHAERLFESLCEDRHIWERVSRDQKSYQRRYAKQAGYGKRALIGKSRDSVSITRNN